MARTDANKTEYVNVDTAEKLCALNSYFLERFSSNGDFSLAVDFEEESNLHIYGEHLCLIQIYDGAAYYLVDAWVLSRDSEGREALRALLENPVCKIMYSCQSDAAIARKSLGIILRNVYDVRVVASALGYEGGLLELIRSVLGIEVPQGKHKFQRSNWTRRPLTEEMKEYALGDVRYLFSLKDSLEEILGSKSAALRSDVHHALKHCAEQKHKDRPGWEKLPGYRNLSREEKVFARFFFEARDQIAKRENLPASNILEKSLIVEMAKKKDWEGVLPEGRTKNIAGRYSVELEKARCRAQTALSEN